MDKCGVWLANAIIFIPIIFGYIVCCCPFSDILIIFIILLLACISMFAL